MTEDTLGRRVVRTHEGVIVEIGRYSPEGAESAAKAGCALYALAGPLTLAGLGLPGAWLVEHMGWWLVNETVLVYRWLMYGVPVWVALVALGWFAWFAPPRQRLEVTPRWLGVTHHRLAWTTWRARFPMETITTVSVVGLPPRERVRIRHRGGMLDIPITVSDISAPDLCKLIDRCAFAARVAETHGTVREVPAELRRLLERDG